MKTNLCRSLLAILTLWLLPSGAQALPDWVPGKNLLISRSINSWNSDNKAKVTVDIQRSGLFKVKLDGALWESTVLALTGKITNNSDDTLAAVLIDYIVSNKKTNTEVIRLRLAIAADVYKTATLEFKNPFKSGPYTSKKDAVIVLETVKAAVEQLGDNYQWSYEFVAAVPQAIISDKGDDAYRAMNVDQVLIEASP
jgi:hypothetical protein